LAVGILEHFVERPCSMAMMVCRVTPMRCASCACVISPWANRSARIALVILVGLPMTARYRPRR